MTAPESAPDPNDAAKTVAADWEAFYRDYRKPGYVPGFEITSKLGGGMFGLVFRARKQSIGKDYAIKFLQVDDTEVRRAVLAELEQVKWFAQIDHPNLVSIEDRGEVDGIPYLVMSFAGTETLRDRMPSADGRTGGAPPSPEQRDELVRYFLQCCRGLSALHERSLVHFDIKPANVFLKGSVARLGDYGLSKLVTHSRGSLSMGRGTPYYMAPEMLQRRGDLRSDIYSLGVMLYEILCGRVPFTGDSEWEVLRQHETKTPDLPPHLTAIERAVLQRCLQKDPAARFQSVHDLIAAFGSPASAGAAAWNDVRAGVGPPPAPSTVPAADAEDHVAALGRASRDAAHHAKHVAVRAFEKAREIVEQATQKLQTKTKEIAARDRGRHVQRWLHALGRLRDQEKARVARRQALQVARDVARASAPRRGGVFRFVASALAMLFVVGVLAMLFLTPRRLSPTAVEVASAGQTDTRSGMFDAYIVPPTYENVISMAEPAWVELAAVDRDAAREVLLARIQLLREAAPLSPARREEVGAVPSFNLAGIHSAPVHGARQSIDALLRGPTYLTDVADRALRTHGAYAVVAAALLLRDAEWTSPRGVERAARLHRFLVDASGCRDILWIDGPSDEPATVGRRNRHLGQLWLWFVNEFAHDVRTWDVYNELMPH